MSLLQESQSGDKIPEESNNSETNSKAHANTFIHPHYVKFKAKPEQVEELLSNELLNLSLQQRNNYQDEIHGVRCIAPEETPEFLQQSLLQMTHELENVINFHQKRAYLKTKDLPNSYTHGDDFRLRFLRCELFDVPKASLRMALFLDLLVDLFGEFALHRPIRLSDFNKRELIEFRKGRMQILPNRDRGGAGSGRRIMCIFPDRTWELIPPSTRHKISLYLIWVAGYDVDTQRKGIVILVWLEPSLEPSKRPAFETKIHQLPSVRVSGLHICSPNTPFYRFRRSLVIMAAGNYRSMLRVHVGEPTELRYALQGFGFPSDKIPITNTGSVKNLPLKKWMNFRNIEEDERIRRAAATNNGGVLTNNVIHNSKTTHSGTNINYMANEYSVDTEMIESPYLTDVLFRKGNSMSNQPGNATLRRLIKSKIMTGAFETDNCRTRPFVEGIIEDMKQECNRNNNPPVRLLEWDDRGGRWWLPINDEYTIYMKIRHIVKEYHDEVSKEKRKVQQMIKQGGGTSIFQNQHGSDSTAFSCPSSKRSRLDGSIESDEAQCFGGNCNPFT